jgi:hypothetical protein
MIDMNHCFKRNDSIIFKELGEGPALIDPYRRTLISLNPAALEIWQLLDGERSVSGIIDALREIFDADEKVLEKDTVNFLDELAKREIIR